MFSLSFLLVAFHPKYPIHLYFQSFFQSLSPLLSILLAFYLLLFIPNTQFICIFNRSLNLFLLFCLSYLLSTCCFLFQIPNSSVFSIVLSISFSSSVYPTCFLLVAFYSKYPIHLYFQSFSQSLSPLLSILLAFYLLLFIPNTPFICIFNHSLNLFLLFCLSYHCISLSGCFPIFSAGILPSIN